MPPLAVLTPATKDAWVGFAVTSLKVKLEVAIQDELLDRVLDAIQKSANTGKIGDGKIFVFDLGQIIRIRTGETGAEAL